MEEAAPSGPQVTTPFIMNRGIVKYDSNSLKFVGLMSINPIMGAETWSFGLVYTEISNADNTVARPNSMVREFVITASIVIVCGMFFVGAWLTRQIKDGVIEHTAFATAIFMERYIQPQIRELTVSKTLSPAAIEELDRIVKQRLIAEHLVSIKIWLLDGTVAYSTYRPIIGRQYPVEDALLAATKGQIATEYGDVKALENEYERSLNVDLIEVYAPMYEPSTQRLFAVSEFYVEAGALQADLPARYFESWLVVGGVAILMIVLTSGAVMRGNKTIKRQQLELQGQVENLSTLLAENKELGAKVESATRDKTVIIDQYMQRISAELHDGPAQHLALASLRLNSLSEGPAKSSKSKGGNGTNLAGIQKELKNAMSEIRMIAAGLTMPELAHLSLGETLELAAVMHEHRTATIVQRDIGQLPESTSIAIKSNLYRFAQEGLNNAYSHADGVGQKLSAHMSGTSIVIEVSDTGPGFIGDPRHFEAGKLGLQGLKNRIAILGGWFEIKTSKIAGTHIIATVPITTASKDNEISIDGGQM
jgi:signal transduction histidine kinase